MSLTWFKFPHDLPDRLDIQALPVEHKWAWVVLLCQASKSSERGIVEGLEEDIAHICGFRNVQDYQYFLDKLRQRGLIESIAPGKIKLAQWEKDQHQHASKTPDAVKDRVRRHREKKKREQKLASVTTAVTPVSKQPETSANPESCNDTCNGDVTVKRNETPKTLPVTPKAQNRQSLETTFGKEFQPTECNGNDDVTTKTLHETTGNDIDTDTDLDQDLDPDPEVKNRRSSDLNFSIAASPSSGGVTQGEDSTGVIYPEVLEPSLFPEEPYTTAPPTQRLHVVDGGEKEPRKPTISQAEACEKLREIYNEFRPRTWARWDLVNPERMAKFRPILKTHGLKKTCEILEGSLRWASQDNWWGSPERSRFNIDTLLCKEKNRLVQFYESWCGITNEDGSFNPLAVTDARSMRLAQTLHRRLAAVDDEISLATVPQQAEF